PPPPEQACLGAEAPAGAETMWLETRDGAAIEAVVAGTGPDVAIFLHQTNLGYCGFLPYVTWLESQGVMSILVSLCTYGESVCPRSLGPMQSAAGAVETAVGWSRDEGAQRVTAVGASMGGTIVMDLAARQGDAGGLDAVVNLSGPMTFGGVDVDEVVADVRIPVLFAIAPGDRVSVERVEEVADAAVNSAVTQVEVGPSGHGWELLTADAVVPSPIGATVLDWIHGSYE
ncbi:MAG: alpha/beta hydrolase, partial [Jiangellaceae bacterium]